jgi:hypothetical protein
LPILDRLPMSEHDPIDSEPASSLARSESLRRTAAGLLVGTLLGLIVTLVILRWWFADRTPPLTEDALRSARQRWKQAGPASYNVEIRVQGPQPATYRVEVRDGQAVAAFRNGRPLLQRRTFGTWSVPGMFGTIDRDLAQLKQQREKGEQQLTLRADFDPVTGMPRRYVRMERSAAADVIWDVTRFEEIAPASSAGGAK